jgi:hypothetical protein
MRGTALDDAASEAAAQRQREICAASRLDPFWAPAAELRVEAASLMQVAGMQLQVDHWI